MDAEQEPLLSNQISSSSSCSSPCRCAVCVCNVVKLEPTTNEPLFSFWFQLCPLPRHEGALKALIPAGGDLENGKSVLLNKNQETIRAIQRLLLANVNALVSVTVQQGSANNADLTPPPPVYLRCTTAIPAAFMDLNSSLRQRLVQTCLEQIHQRFGFDVVPVDAPSALREQNASQLLPAIPMSHRETDDKDTASRAVFEVGGMKCASCVNSLESALLNIGGVQSAAISLLLGRATVTFDDALVSVSELADTVRNCGFEHVSITSTSTSKHRVLNLDTTCRFLVQGMTCSSCAATIENKLRQNSAVKTVSISVLTTECQITYDSQHSGARDLLDTINSLGFEASIAPVESKESAMKRHLTKESQKNFRRLILVSIAAIPTFIIAMILDMLLPDTNPAKHWLMLEVAPGLHLEALILFLLATPVQFLAGANFYRSAFKSLYQTGSPNMDVLVVLGTTAAYIASVLAIVFNMINKSADYMPFFETSVLLIFFIYLGRYLELSAKVRTASEMLAMLDQRPSYATLIRLNPSEDWEITHEEKLSPDLLQVGDVLQLAPNQIFPCDGLVIRGSSSVNESMLTGEPQLQSKTSGSEVYAGTINVSSLIYIKASRVGSETTLQRIVKLVEDAQSRKADIQQIADSISRWFVWVVLCLAFIDFMVWGIIGWTGHVPPDWLPRGTTPTILALYFTISSKQCSFITI
jgi:Cu+-exporting ATPase